jgi:hypothetical protein
MAVVNEDPAPASQDGVEVPEDVLAVVRRCLAKAPEERYQRAGELEVALLGCRCAAGWTEARAADWWAGHPEELRDDGTDLNGLPLRESAGSGTAL